MQFHGGLEILKWCKIQGQLWLRWYIQFSVFDRLDYIYLSPREHSQILIYLISKYSILYNSTADIFNNSLQELKRSVILLCFTWNIHLLRFEPNRCPNNGKFPAVHCQIKEFCRKEQQREVLCILQVRARVNDLRLKSSAVRQLIPDQWTTTAADPRMFFFLQDDEEYQ